MRYCPFCAERLATPTVFCHDCGRRLPASIPTFKPSRGWRLFAARYNDSAAHERTAAWERLSSRQRYFLARRLGLSPPRIESDRTEVGRLGLASSFMIGLAGIFLLTALLAPPRGVRDQETPGDLHSETLLAPLGTDVMETAPPPEAMPRLRQFLLVTVRSNVRGAPSLRAPVVGKAFPGERLEFAEEQGDWYLLVSDDPDGARYIHRAVAKKLARTSAE